MAEVRIEYVRPGKGTTLFLEDLVFVDSFRLNTFKRLPSDAIPRLAQNLVAEGLIAPHQKACTIAKTYFFDKYFNLLEFYNENGDLLGYYSDIGTPLTYTGSTYTMTDWFLDIWLDADGRLVELDLDEFDEAVAQNLLTSVESEQARRTFTRLVEEVRAGIYPYAYR